MKKKTIYLFAILSIFIFTGCVKTPNINFNAQMHKNIKNIAIIPPKKVKELTIFYFNHPGMNFGLVGGVMAAAEFNSKTSTYNKLIAPIKFDANHYFLSKLTSYLKEEKYNVILLPVDEKRKNEYLKEYPDVPTDAYLDIVLGQIGYIAGSPTATYKPTVKVTARLVKKVDKTILYDKYLATGENFALAEEVDYLGCDTKDCHKDFDTLKTNAKMSVEGIQKALDKVAKRLALSLKKGK
jgi:hypothetical protein